MTYGERILIERRRRGLRQDALGVLVGLSPATIVDIEKGRTEITETEYLRIMAAMQAEREAVNAA